MGVKRLLENIESGKKGRNIGISTGMTTLDSVIFGIQRKYLYTIGADTAGGKTSFAIDTFVYNLIKNGGDKNLAILYYSFEMSGDILYAKLLARRIYDEYGEVITYEDILSLTKPISNEQAALVEMATPWLLSLEDKVTIYDKALSPNGIYATCKQWLKRFGTFVDIAEHKEEYVEDDPSQYRVVVIDHVGLITGPGSKKEKIDLTTDYLISFRNKCGITGIFVQQLNRNAKSMDRKTNGYELIQLDDFKDTSGTTDASEVVIALYFPYREKIARCEGYPIQNVLKKRFRLCQILKNRYGQADVNKGLLFYGEIGMFAELPKPEDIGDYEPYLTLNKRPKILDIIEEKDVNENDIFKF
jgi:replicative DNA helicase